MKTANIKYLILSLLLVSSLILNVGCELLPNIDITISPPPNPTATTVPAAPPAPPPTANPINPTYMLPGAEGNTLEFPSIADVVSEVRPSVVAINTEVVTYDIFRRSYTQKGAGSGWILDANGLIVTNNHVVEGAKTVTVTLADDRSFTAETIRTDPLTDLAIVKIAASNLPEARIGDSSELRVGEWVVAIGNALGRGISAKEGIISRVGVSIEVSQGQTLYELLETSAAINPGNSGGPLVNMAGEVIGITSAKLAAIGIEGMGYAISSNQASPIIEELVQKGYVVRPWLGVVLYPVNEWLATRYNLAVDKGAFITEIAPGSPAEKAGLEPGDVIVDWDGEEITNTEDMIKAIHSGQIGYQVKITFWRGDSKSVVYAMLAESPPPP